MPTHQSLQHPVQPQQLPQLGVGLGLRRPLFQDTMANRDKIDWLEIIAENHMDNGGFRWAMIEEALELGFPIVSHGVNLSLGSIDPFNETYLQELEALFQRIQPAWFSDHLCFTCVDGVYLNDLIPLPHTWETVHHVVKRIQTIQARFETPFLVENVSTYAIMAHEEMTEAQFITEIVERSGCGLLLDVNNIYVNAQNHHYNPIAFLDQIPLEQVVQVHIAGHLRQQHAIIDTHGTDVCPEVWEILEALLRRTPVNGILLERDTNLPTMEAVLAELEQIRRIVDNVQQDNKAMKPAGGEV